jgi:hypothetical protein
MGNENYPLNGHMTALLPQPHPRPGGDPRFQLATVRVVFVPLSLGPWAFLRAFVKSQN